MKNENANETVQSEPRKLEKPVHAAETKSEELVAYANESGGGGEVEVTT